MGNLDLAGLDKEQAAAVADDAEPLCVVAPAGSGKTRVLTLRVARRVSEGKADPQHTLVLTFTRKAASELRVRLSSLGVPGNVTAGTFHSIAFAELRRFWADRWIRPLNVLESKSRILREVVRELEIDLVSATRGAVRGAQYAPDAALEADGEVLEGNIDSGPRGLVEVDRAGDTQLALTREIDHRVVRRLEHEIAREIEWAKARVVAPEMYVQRAVAAGRHPPVRLADVAAAFERYEAEKRRRGVLDMDDLVERCASVMEQDAGFAAARRWRYRHFFVDEFQDVNPAQFRLLSAWLGGRRDLFVVGDPDQAIYAWNGSDPELMNRFTDHFPGAVEVFLRKNYRSSPQVVGASAKVLLADHDSGDDGAGGLPGVDTDSGGDIAHLGGGNEVVKHARETPLRTADSTRPRGTAGSFPDVEQAERQLRKGRPPVVSMRPDGPEPVITAYDSEAEEALGVAQALRGAHQDGIAWQRLAVLARTNALLANVRQALVDSRVPIRTSGVVGPPALAEALAGLERALRRSGQVGRATGGTPFDVLVTHLSALSDRGQSSLRRGPMQPGTARALLSCALEYQQQDPSPTSDGLAGWLATAADRSASVDGSTAGVELLTFHRAKGLEWKAVFLVGLEDGLVPIGHATTAAARAEERRLLHVAMTRAELQLHCSWSKVRTVGGRRVKRSPSPYLATMARAPSKGNVNAPQRGLSELIAKERERLAAIPVVDLHF
ncbi:MAG: ATP-dependent helicase [Acidimicrobiales bacterium]